MNVAVLWTTNALLQASVCLTLRSDLCVQSAVLSGYVMCVEFRVLEHSEQRCMYVRH